MIWLWNLLQAHGVTLSTSAREGGQSSRSSPPEPDLSASSDQPARPKHQAVAPSPAKSADVNDQKQGRNVPVQPCKAEHQKGQIMVCGRVKVWIKAISQQILPPYFCLDFTRGVFFFFFFFPSFVISEPQQGKHHVLQQQKLFWTGTWSMLTRSGQHVWIQPPWRLHHVRNWGGTFRTVIFPRLWGPDDSMICAERPNCHCLTFLAGVLRFLSALSFSSGFLQWDHRKRI